MFLNQNQLNGTLKKLRSACSKNVDSSKYPFSSGVDNNVVIYESETFYDQTDITALQTEIVDVLQSGPGVLLIKKAWSDAKVLSDMTNIFWQIIEKESDNNQGDHFGSDIQQSNARIWNSFQKCAILEPEIFIHYFSNPILMWVSQAWLGPHYQVTAQVNIVLPGGQSQTPHRDYHMGFQDSTDLLDFPAHIHNLTPLLTLQGAVAHSNMPIESGPTLLLPFSHQVDEGYVGFRQQACKDYFMEKAVQIPLERGDALFFNPALYHAAGSNVSSNIKRCANLLQISSVYAKSMEFINHKEICLTAYPTLQNFWKIPSFTPAQKLAILTAMTDGYPFPTNLDLDPPTDSISPPTGYQLLEQALKENWDKAELEQQLTALMAKKGS